MFLNNVRSQDWNLTINICGLANRGPVCVCVSVCVSVCVFCFLLFVVVVVVVVFFWCFFFVVVFFSVLASDCHCIFCFVLSYCLFIFVSLDRT